MKRDVMTVKLTLSVDRQVVEKAKRYARKRHRSLSALVTNYPKHVTAEDEGPFEIDPLVQEVADEIPPDTLPKLSDPKYRYLKDKYRRGRAARP
ncbi:MAG: hypothetical protein HY706_12630 [Candidatus Hydrogenedentes bacterium]|nr:hypothetical protein [Candidatus Hydrogenedentota bacterium]